jgi:uncharacterized membrane protein
MAGAAHLTADAAAARGEATGGDTGASGARRAADTCCCRSQAEYCGVPYDGGGGSPACAAPEGGGGGGGWYARPGGR